MIYLLSKFIDILTQRPGPSNLNDFLNFEEFENAQPPMTASQAEAFLAADTPPVVPKNTSDTGNS